MWNNETKGGVYKIVINWLITILLRTPLTPYK